MRRLQTEKSVLHAIYISTFGLVLTTLSEEGTYERRFEDLPIEIRERVFSFTREVDGNIEVTDTKGLVDFVYDNAPTYPALWDLVKLNEEKLTEHAKETGEVPPGVKLIKTTQVEGQNVTQVRIYHGPTIIPEGERD